MSAKNIPHLLLVIIALTLAACAPAAAIDPMLAPIAPTDDHHFGSAGIDTE